MPYYTRCKLFCLCYGTPCTLVQTGPVAVECHFCFWFWSSYVPYCYEHFKPWTHERNHIVHCRIRHEHYLKCMDGKSSTLVVTANTSQRRLLNPRFKHNKNHFKQNFSNTAPSKRPSVVCQICEVTLPRTVSNCSLHLLPIILLLRLHRMPNGFMISLLLIILRLIWLIFQFILSMMARMRWFLEMVQVCMLLILVPLLFPLLPALLV